MKRGARFCVLPCILAWVLCLGTLPRAGLGQEAAVVERVASASDVAAGRQIYEQGLLPSGEPLRGTVVGDVMLEGAQVQCASCHRRSGFGTSEGGAYVAPIAEPWLFGTTPPDRADLFRKLYREVQSDRMKSKVRSLQVRPPYTDETLATALRTGQSIGGHELDPLMPRYQLDDTAMAQLIAYLRTLGQGEDPGVDAEEIHFATVIAGDVDTASRQAMMEVMDAFFRRKNAEIEAELERPGHSPYHRDEFHRALRRWVLHVWELDGPRSTWPEQLEASYRHRPVFAMLSGLGEGSWRPVHELCERHRVPCLFPNTTQPVVSEAGDYALYLSRGLTVEGAALARHLDHRQLDSATPSRLVEMSQDNEGAQELSRALRASLSPELQARLEARIVETHAQLPASTWPQLLRAEAPTTLILWLDDVTRAEAELEALARTAEVESVAGVYLSYRLLGDAVPKVPSPLADRVFLTYPYALPGQEVPRIHRVRAWLRSRRIPETHERLRLNTYFALSIADHALVHLVESFSRDYFIEGVEHEAENSLNPGVFPHLSLGPGQRFASKGSYVVQVSDDGIEPLSEWIVP